MVMLVLISFRDCYSISKNVFFSVLQAIQMFRNHRTKNPGQLSAMSSFLCIFQGFGRLTTSIIITGDYVMINTFAAVSLFNVLLFIQVLYYRWRLKKMA